MMASHSRRYSGARFRAQSFDLPLLGLLLLLIGYGLIILYSASNENLSIVLRQALRLTLALGIMGVLSFVPPHKYKNWTPWIFFSGLTLLLTVMLIGKIGKGAQRWLDIGLIRFQPSEIMKLAMPMMMAWYLDRRQSANRLREFIIAGILLLLPTLLIAQQPDLGTAIMVAASGLCVIFVAGIPGRIIAMIITSISLASPLICHFMHDYQKQRIYTLLNPEQNPLGAGYHIIQSKIAIGSGGAWGKGWLQGSQSHLNFLPEHATDFIFAVCGEEFGFVGSLILVVLMVFISLRGIMIAQAAQTAYSRFLAAGLVMSFFLSAFVNMGMVMGILPVVGIPLPLVSYGGSALITFLASFGILMSIHSHRILFNQRF